MGTICRKSQDVFISVYLFRALLVGGTMAGCRNRPAVDPLIIPIHFNSLFMNR